jgi:class 3 adenylate cyclase/tetratricopeptide (TPR) repeat protein
MATSPERKLVSVLFCDLVGSTQLGEQLDAEALHALKNAYFARVQSLIAAYQGVVEKFIGDAVVAIFGVPAVHEDDAERAVLCALDITNACEELNTTLRRKFGVGISVRIGVNTGEVMIDSTAAGDIIASGDILNTAARLQQAADPGAVLVGRDTMLLTRSSVEHAGPRQIRLKGKEQPVEVWTALGPRSTKRAEAGLVGREWELQILNAAVDLSLQGGGPQVVLVFGEPGIGKSRLADELESRLAGRAAVYRGACVPYGEGATWAPLAEVVTAEIGVSRADPEHTRRVLALRLANRHPPEEAALIEAQLEALLGTSHREVAGSELLWALRRYFEAAAREFPAVIVLDDLHWASETLLETLQELIETMPSVPITLLLLGRPELRQRLSTLATGHEVTVVNLEALGPEPAHELASKLAGRLGLEWSADLEAGILERAGGNPLFVEELSAMAAEENSLSGLPRSLSALLAARLDALASVAREAVQAAAVIGEVFWDTALSQLADGEHRSVTGALRILRTEGLVREEPHSILVGCRQFRFRHALMRETAYRSLAKQRRSQMHQRLATWFSDRTAHRPELLGVVAHHFDRAVTLSEEVTPFAAPDDDLLEVAVESLIRAGRWTAGNAALADAIRMLRRAVELADANPAKRDLAAGELATALATAGELEEAVALAGEVVHHDARPEAAAVAHLALARAAYVRGDSEAIREHGVKGLELARSLSSPGVEALLLEILAWADGWGNQWREAGEKWERAAEKGLEAGNLALVAAATSERALLQVFALDIAAAEQIATEALRMAQESGSLRALAYAHCAMARVRELQDRLEEAVDHGLEWVRLTRGTGETIDEIAASVFGIAEPLIGLNRHSEAWDHLERAAALSEQLGGSAYDTNVRYNRARVLLVLGRLDQAETEVQELERLAESNELWDTTVDWAKGMSLLQEARGQLDDRPEETLRRSLANRLSKTESDWQEVEALMRFAEVLIQRNKSGEALDIVNRIRSKLEGRGATRLERKLRGLESLLASEAGPGRPAGDEPKS